MSVNEVLEAVRAMSPEERAKVRALIDALGNELRTPEQRARERLCEVGLLSEGRPRTASARARLTPVAIEGKPLSETVIEDRG